jgi:hypothetical protein
MKMEKEFEQDGAMFNIGLSTAIEIRTLLSQCNQHSRIGYFDQWYTTLLCLEREVRPEMKEGDDKNLKGMLPSVIKAVDDWQRTDLINNRNKAYTQLHLYEIELRQIIKKRGLGMPDKEDDDGL